MKKCELFARDSGSGAGCHGAVGESGTVSGGTRLAVSGGHELKAAFTISVLHERRFRRPRAARASAAALQATTCCCPSSMTTCSTWSRSR